MYMSENLYPARLKQNSNSRAAVWNKQKREHSTFITSEEYSLTFTEKPQVAMQRYSVFF